MDSISCPVCGECQWDVDDCALVEETLEIQLTTNIKRLEQLCIDIYMSYHVSQIRLERLELRRVWHTGQRLYEERKR